MNLERPLRLADRLGGHLVQGHVDGVGEVVGRRPQPDGSTRVDRRDRAGDLARYVVEKGSDHGRRREPHDHQAVDERPRRFEVASR